MANNFQFKTPADQLDFQGDAAKQAKMSAQWDLNMTSFTEQGMTGNPWNASNSSPITNYFNPKVTDIPDGSPMVPVIWNVFPNRINYYCIQQAGISQENAYSLADTGYMTDGKTSFPEITNPCTGDKAIYGPYGPRGWQDEYCEWSITRDTNGNITRIDLTCESPEYFNTLWMTDPNKVLEIYQNTLGKPQIKLTDLCMTDANGAAIIDPSTGNGIYNPLNKWNSGTSSTATEGGAMHLTSTPNTIQTDICLATAATIPRISTSKSNMDPNDALLCCAAYGQPYRNSDPNIGASVNGLSAQGIHVTVANPPGLYMQVPDSSLFKFPAGTQFSDYYKVIRGNETIDGLPGNFILHAVFEAPQGHTLQEVLINKEGNFVPLVWAAQLAETINNQIVAQGFPSTPQAPMACVGTPATSYIQPLQLFHKVVYDTMSTTNVPNPVNNPMTTLSNTTLIAPLVAVGSSAVPMVATCVLVEGNNGIPVVTFSGEGVTATVTDYSETITYAVPGNSYPSSSNVLRITVNVAANAPTGMRDMFISYGSDLTNIVALPSILNIVSSIN